MAMTKQSAASFAAWLAKDQPQLFLALAKNAGVPVQENLSGISDVLSAIGSGLSSAVKTVGSFVTSKEGMTTLSTLATTYLTTKAQQDAVKLQIKQAEAQEAAAPIQTSYNAATGQYEVLYTTKNGQTVPVTSQTANAVLNGGSITSQAWFPYAAAAGVAFVLFLVLRRR